jgi:RnfABCDGE-type electron transport complex G subunit
VRFPLTLAVIAALAGGGLAFVEVGTKERVEQNKKRKLNAAFKDVPGCVSNRPLQVPAELAKKYGKDAKCFELFDRPIEEVQKAEEEKRDIPPIGYAAQVKCTEPTCYNGTDPIVLVVAVDAKIEKILVLRTTNNAETPGLGTRVSQQKPSRALLGEQPKKDAPKYTFLSKFKDRPTDRLDSYEKGTKFDVITGATISSMAVLGGARKAVGLLKEVVGGKP